MVPYLEAHDSGCKPLMWGIRINQDPNDLETNGDMRKINLVNTIYPNV